MVIWCLPKNTILNAAIAAKINASIAPGITENLKKINKLKNNKDICVNKCA
jgi:hypothetical protein